MAGVLLVILGGGLVASSFAKIGSFLDAYASDAAAFVTSEIERVDNTMGQYAIAVFRVIPLIVLVCAALIVVLHGPVWRAGLITTIAMMSVIMLVDSNADAPLQTYKEAARREIDGVDVAEARPM